MSKKKWIIYGILNLVTALLSVSIALIIELTINTVSGKRMENFNRIIGIAIVFIIFYYLFNYIRNFYMQKMADEHIYRLRNTISEKIMSYSFAEFEKRPISEYLSILTNDVQMYQEGALKSKLIIAQNVISAIVVILTLIFTNVGIACLIVVCTVFNYAVPKFFKKRISLAQEEVSNKLSEVTENITDNLEGFYVISTYQHRKKACKIFDFINRIYYLKKVFLDKLLTKSESLSMSLSVGTELFILFVSAKLVFMKMLNIGEMVAIMQLTGAFVQPLMMIMSNLPKISSGKAVEERFSAILGETNVVQEKKGVEELPFQDSICLKEIGFVYENGKRVFKDVSLKIEKGKKYAIVGGSGAGKTTLINVINGLYRQTEGTISVDGLNVEEKFPAYMNLFATVGQNAFLFNTTIERNITLTEEADKKQLEYACEISGVKEILKEFTHGLNEKIKDNGMNLSGGQKQKIALARAMYYRKSILILDESMSAIDKKSAYEIEKRLLEMEGVTVLAITHDIHSLLLKMYDEIVVVNNGVLECRG